MLHFRSLQRLFNPPPCASTGKRGGTVRNLTPQSKLIASLILLLSLFLPALAAAHSVGLSWDASTSQNIIGYNVYRGPTANGPFTKINTSLDTTTAYTDTTPTSAKP
jgi:hypothetical protein